VSRGFRRLQDGGLVAVDRREIELLDIPRLEAMAASILRG
jgi:CRP/FNR family transcriptional regulator, anaerobic regulatory protein